ncbi:MAG: hypothetical protein A7315_04250 [Candidatus Altiarchaeales archaeon WOR_SM1_79]|nr:MAG: hypothetical protein A7315_04250 [Candidatus Altiarchaeales archaeon WOR_SM1_79]
MDRISTGLSGLDRLLGGGLPGKTIVLLSGGAGTGKTLIGLNFLLEGALKGERCCYVSLNEDKNELIRACNGIKSLKRINEYVDRNLIIEPVTMGKRIPVDYFTKIFSSYPQVDRLVIDSLNKLLIFAEKKSEYRIHLAELITYLKDRINCTLLTCETQKDEIDTGNGEAFECDGVIHLSFLEFEEKPKRTLEVTKMRYTSFEPKVPHELVIDKEGLRLTETQIF